jgi:folate-dependent phosphoribosylglycinamide formyltransferase PurN
MNDNSVKENYKLIYEGNPKDFTWVGFGSGSGTNLRECAKIIPPALIFSDKPDASLFKHKELKSAEFSSLNGYEWCGSWKKAKGNKELTEQYLEKSKEFNEKIYDILKDYSHRNQKGIDLIVLGGYMRLIMDPLLSEYKDKIINVHPADLTIKNGIDRNYIGEDAVYDAIVSGMTKTRSSVILVDKGEDHGEILTMGPYVHVWNEIRFGTEAERNETIREYADAHQTLQKVRSDWPALVGALKMISDNRIGIGIEKHFDNEWRQIFIDNKPMNYGGYDFNKN